MLIQTIAVKVGREEVDYQFLLAQLMDYQKPRDKISLWLKTGDLVRVKKGLYVFGKNVTTVPYSHEVLANLIYGPSAISLSYALSFYGLIPERVTTVTSITTKRDKSFSTPVGEFTYKYLKHEKYGVGLTLSEINPEKHFIIVTPEKALCDHICLIDKKIQLVDDKEMDAYLLNDLRIDQASLREFDVNHIAQISDIYRDLRLILLKRFIRRLKVL